VPPARVQIWQLDLEPPPPRLKVLDSALSADERRRADRFQQARHRDRFTAARGLLRFVLASHLPGVTANSLVFRYGEHGKPALDRPLHARSLGFSLSHSAAHGLLAVAWRHTLGADIEAQRRETEVDNLAQRFFSPGEAAALARIPDPNLRRAAFFRCWTRKEAYIKALGTGVFKGLDSFDVNFSAHEPAAVLTDRQHPEAPARWSMTPLPAPPGFSAALVVDGPLPEIEHWSWDWTTMTGRPSGGMFRS
jgi:4'-phosphopantetheinyl transferase